MERRRGSRDAGYLDIFRCLERTRTPAAIGWPETNQEEDPKIPLQHPAAAAAKSDLSLQPSLALDGRRHQSASICSSKLPKPLGCKGAKAGAYAHLCTCMHARPTRHE